MKLECRKNPHQVMARIPSKLIVAMQLKEGDLFEWKLFNGKSLKMVKHIHNERNHNSPYKIFRRQKILWVTIPTILFCALNWKFIDQYEWIIHKSSLVLKKDLSAYAQYARQNLE